MIILHIANITDTSANGINVVVPKHVIYQSNYAEVALLNLSNYEYKNDKIKVYNKKNIDQIEEPFNKPDIVIFHGLYYIGYLKIAKKLKKEKIPYIIVPHGSLSKKAIKTHFFKFIKKAVAHVLFFNSFINKSRAIQFLSKGEQSISYFKKKGIIIPNGIEIPSNFEKMQNVKDQINITFIGRKDIKIKGLDLLLKAVNKAKNDLLSQKVKINIYGTNDKKADKFINNFIKRCDLQDVIKNNGPVFNEQKEAIFKKTDIFIQTSRTEGLPTAVLEAMSYQIPVLITKGTSIYEDVLMYQCGWVAETNVKSIKKAIIKSISDKEKIFFYGNNAQKFVRENYLWNEISKDCIEKYLSLASI